MSRAASRRGRAAPARRSRRPSSPTASGHAAHELGHRRPRRRSGESSRLTSPPIRSISASLVAVVARRRPRASCAGSRGQRAAARRCDERLPEAARRARRAIRRRPGSSSESTSSSSSSGARRRGAPPAAPPRRAAARARPSRCSPCEPNARRSRLGRARSTTSSRCGPDAGRAALEVAVEPRLELLHASAARPRSASSAPGRPSSPARSANARLRAAAIASRRASTTSSAPSAADLLVPRRERVARRDAQRDPPERGVPLRRAAAPYSAGSAGAGRAAAGRATRSKYARRAAGPPLTTTSRSGVKTSVATSPRSCSAARSRAPFSVARLPLAAARASTSSSSGTPARDAAQRDPRRRPAEADELRVGARARREALRADVQRLEQVRLAGAVRPDRRARAPARARARAARRSGSRLSATDGDDQPARRIGMIRYRKSSPSPCSSAGRSGLISFSAQLVADAPTRSRRAGTRR